MSDPEALEAELGRGRPVWVYLVGFVVVLAAAVVGVAMWPDAPQPYRVLVAVDGLDEEASRRLLGNVRAPLGVGGFRVLEVASGEPPADAESLRQLAPGALAEHSVFVVVETVDERARGTIEPAFVLLRAHAVVGHIDGEPNVDIPPVEIAAFGPTLEEAAIEAAERIGAALADGIHLVLVERDSVSAFVQSTSIATDEISTQASIRAASERIERVHEELGWMTSSCGEAELALNADEGPHPVRCVASACAEEYAFDVLPDGEAALVHTETPSVRLPLVGELVAAERVESVESIELVPLDGGARRVLGTASNYYTYPSMSADGSKIALVEEWPRGFGLVVIDVESGERTALARFEGYLQSPHLSPDGSLVLASLRARRRAPAQLVVMPTRVGAELRLVGEAHVARWVNAALPEHEGLTLVIAELVGPPEPGPDEPVEEIEVDEIEETPEEEEELAEGELPRLELERQLALLDPADGSVLARMEDDRHRVRRVIGERDGAVHFTWYNGRVCGLGHWRAGEPPTFVATEGCLRHAHLSAGDVAVGTLTQSLEGDPDESDDEMAMASLSDGAVTVLTANALRERYPRAAATGRRVIFDRLGTSRYREFPRVAPCWLSLPE